MTVGVGVGLSTNGVVLLGFAAMWCWLRRSLPDPRDRGLSRQDVMERATAQAATLLPKPMVLVGLGSIAVGGIITLMAALG